MHKALPMIALAFSVSCFVACNSELNHSTAQEYEQPVEAEQQSENKPLQYTCKIPETLKHELVIHEKDGTDAVVDAHVLYRLCHAEGWYAVLNCYNRTMQTEAEGLYPLQARQETGFNSVARDIGGTEAKAALLKLKLSIGQENLAAMVARELSSQTEGLSVPPPPESRDGKRMN